MAGDAQTIRVRMVPPGAIELEVKRSLVSSNEHTDWTGRSSYILVALFEPNDIDVP